jgi:hypothetical protein
LSTLLCAAAIEWDGKPVPLKLIAPALVVGLTAPIAIRALHPLAVSRDFGAWLASRIPEGVAQVLASLATSLAGLALGAVLGCLASLAKRTDSRARIDRSAAMLLGGVVGLTLGWQPTAIVASLAMMGFLFIALLGRPFPRFRSIPWSAGLTILVALYMMNGRAFIELLDRPGSGASLLMLLAAIGVTLLCAVAARTVMSKR